MLEQNIKLSVIAYYLSKFDMNAVAALGYSNRTSAIRDISGKVGNGNNYLKQRRDEFDVLTESHRRGYANREPVRSVLELHEELKNISFDDFTNIVLEFINPLGRLMEDYAQEKVDEIDANLSDSEIEAIINAKDSTSKILLRKNEQKVRVYNPSITENLKRLYQYRCQICGYSAQEYDVHIAEAHHILSFSECQNNNSDNIIILCPNHHRIIHRANPVFDRQKKSFVFSKHMEISLMLNLHL